MSDAIIRETGVRKQHRSDAFYCKYCGRHREDILRKGETWFACPEGCEHGDIDKRIAETLEAENQ